jgi:DNA polymerase III delta prime subunit
MKAPILHKRTRLAINLYLNSPSHAIILSGLNGIGKLYVAKWLSHKLNLNIHVIIPGPNKTTVSIDQIRELYSLTKTGNNLAIIVPDSHLMSVPAQNSFLKLLEEAPTSVYFMLTTVSDNAVLSTIKSRSQIIEILPTSISDLLSYANVQDINDTTIKSLAVTTKRSPGTFIKLLSSPDLLEIHKNLISESKTFYTASKFERHVMCINKNFDKSWVSAILDALSIIIESINLNSTLSKHQLKHLVKQANLINEVSAAIINHNGSPKIHMSKLIDQL